MSTFSGLSVALSSLQAQRRAMDVIAQNVSNVNTPGYTRQRAELQAIAPATSLNIWGNVAQTGDGVQVATVTRMTDQVTMNRLRGHEADAGYLSTLSTTLQGVEKDFNEPSTNGLTEQMGVMAASFDAAGNTGTSKDSASLAVAVNDAANVARTIRTGYENVSQRWDGINVRASTAVNDINASLSSIAALNKEIFSANTAGAPANELKDQRDALLTKLSGTVGVDISNADTNPDMVKVSLNGVTLVNGQNVSASLEVSGPGTMPGPVALSAVAADGSRTAIDTTTVKGSLGADLTALNKTLPDVAKGYDAVVDKLTKLMENNSNPGFFTGTAKDFAVAVTDPSTVVVSTPGTYDGKIGDAISVGLKNPATSPATTWQKLVGDTGSASASYATRATASESNRLAAESALSSATGVDIDEEMTNLVATQRAYEAAGKLLSTIDSMLDTLINRTGR